MEESPPCGNSSDLRARERGDDNRPGGSVIVGAEAAAGSAPDGYTIFLGSIVTHSLNPLHLAKLPYRPYEDFVPVTLLSARPMIVATNPPCWRGR